MRVCVSQRSFSVSRKSTGSRARGGGGSGGGSGYWLHATT